MEEFFRRKIENNNKKSVHYHFYNFHRFLSMALDYHRQKYNDDRWRTDGSFIEIDEDSIVNQQKSMSVNYFSEKIE